MVAKWEKVVYKIFEYAPSVLVCLAFLPTGLAFGYTISSFVAERSDQAGLIAYGPMITGTCAGFLTATTMFVIKFIRSRIIFWHTNVLLIAALLHLISSCFYFSNTLDKIGPFVSYLAHSLTFLTGLSFIHSICGKCSRAILLALSFSFYILGITSAVSLTGSPYSKKTAESVNVDFASAYMSIAAVILALLIGLKVLCYLGTADCENSMDNEFRIANSNGSIFDKRDDIIKRIEFFYVTKNQQWNVTLLLIFIDAVQFSLFIYFTFWFSLNSAVRLTDAANIDSMLWMTYTGTVLSTLCLVFFSAKVLFVFTQLSLILFTLISMIVCSSVNTTVVWIIMLFFGLLFSNLQIILIEVSHFLYMELIIYASYACKALSTSIIYYYFISDTKNSYFYSTDKSSVMSQGFVYIIIGSLLALVVGMKVPRTHKTSLFEIQYGLLGIIFQKHQIEQLNVRCLNDGTIPTISN